MRRAQREGLPVELALDIPSDLALVGTAVDLIAGHCHSGPLSRRRVQFNLRTALAEALANAIRYGNNLNPAKLVEIRVTVAAAVVEVRVTDEGGGFDPARLPDPTTPDNIEREDGRGLFVIRHLVDQVTFNKRGNVVCLTLRAL